MITDLMDNADRYADLLPGLAGAFEYARGLGADATDGTFDLPDIGGFAMIMAYDTEPAYRRMLETHKRYVDVQVLLSGRELIQWTPLRSLEPAVGYDTERDLAFWKDAPAAYVLMEPGQFAVFFPSDAHKPNCSVDPGSPSTNKKLVVKVPAQE